MKKRLPSKRARDISAKRPEITVEVTYEPDPVAREALIDLLVEMLDERRRRPR